jgi:DUF4097 and DUF4098 domain-containing protein YvlB
MQKFDTPAPISTVLDIPAGRVQFIAADRADTTVEVLPADPTKNRDVKAAERVTVDYSDGVLRVQTPEPEHQLFGNSGSIEVTIQLPAGSGIAAKVASAEVRGVGRLGDVAVEAAHGSIKLDETADAQLTIQAGDVTVGRLGGPAKISTQKGDIRIAEAMGGEVVLTTQAGDVSIDAAPGVSASLDAGTSSGRISNSLNNTDGAAARLAIRATTAYGNVTARSL